MGLDVGHFGPLWHIYKVGHLMDTDFDAIARGHDVSVADFHMLSALMITSPQAMRATDLAYALHVSNAVLSVRARRLASQGLLVRSASARDRRAVQLELTDAGRDKVKAVGTDLECQARFVRFYRRLPETDKAALERIMRDLHDYMDKAVIPVPRTID